MAFERFTAKGRISAPTLSIRSNGQIAFNKKAVDENELMNYRYAVLFFDPERKAIGIKPTNDDMETGKRRLAVKKGTAFISAHSFLSFYGLNRKKSEKFPLTREGDLLVSEVGEAKDAKEME